MEEDVLLHMYRQSWDDFLEAYKSKIDEVDALYGLLDEVKDKLPKAAREKVEKQLIIIKEL